MNWYFIIGSECTIFIAYGIDRNPKVGIQEGVSL